MSITESMQSTAPPNKMPAKQLPRPSHHRIRRGQKLDEIVSLSEQRLSKFASASSESAKSSTSLSTFSPASSSSSSSVNASESEASSSSNASGDSAFQLQEYLAMLVRRDPHNVETITSLPTEADIESLNADKGKAKDEPEDDGMFQNVDTDVWVYEQLRRLVLDLTTPWLTSLQQECDKHARPQTCAAMNAGDWMYLCASHGEEKQCCAIDYMVHTLDGATSLLNSARHFPSRTYVPNTSLRHFGSIARRLSRIFVHAWCYHKDTFLACEAETSLYSRFLGLVETYDLTATDNLPPRPGHGSDVSDAQEHAAAYEVGDAAEFSRGTSSAPLFTLNGTTAKRERSGTAAMRSSLAQSLQQGPQLQLQPEVTPSSSTAKQVDAVGLVPPPAPSPRATAVLSRPDHEEGDADAPAWTALAQRVKEGSGQEEQDDEEDEEEEEEEEEGDPEDRTQKIEKVDEDATISLRGLSVQDDETEVKDGKNVLSESVTGAQTEEP